ncbi:hypothetical protein GQ42DRAFT_160292 [Ramicandelaber brevisporus]|nr:hypothetical protein GQ42DRAFT_160292 [Ramicandelaber brevisporus]
MGDRLLSTILDRFPNLQSLELIGYSYSKIDFKQFSGRANQSVRFVSIVDDTSVKSIYTIAKLLALFPNTKQLTFNSLNAADLQKMKQLLPGVVVIAKEIKEYENDDSDFDSNFDIDIDIDSDSDADSDAGYDDTDEDTDSDND